MAPNPDCFLKHLRAEGYHPRSDKHSNALAEAIAADLVATCPAIRKKASLGQLVYDINFPLICGTSEWNVDLVFGEPGLSTASAEPDKAIARTRPATVQIAIEIKSVMTEHHKAVKNRKRDLEAHHEHVHHYDAQTIAGAVLVVNGSDRFKSPLRTEATIHKEPKKLVEHCIDELRAVAGRGGTTGYGLESKCVLVVSLDNEYLDRTKYVTVPPAPPVGDPLHYDSFIRTICRTYSERFGE